MKQIVIALVFGGRSAEHAVSVRSASVIHAALMSLGHHVHCVGIDQEGNWRYHGDSKDFPAAVDLNAPVVSIRPGQRTIMFVADDHSVVEVKLDLLFPALHGRWGEDGTIQGLAAMCNLPCVGAGVLGSAVSMDKDVAKRLIQSSGIIVAPWVTLNTMQSWEELVERLGSTTLFVKPASSGSSIGVSRVSSAEAYAQAFAVAAQMDHKILVEAEVCGREIECGVLELKEGLVVSELGEVIPGDGYDYYDYQAKYDGIGGASLCIPSSLSLELIVRIQSLSKQVFRCLDLKGYARIDFFLANDSSIILNEVNTLPGFTDSSMYPKMFEYSGYPLARLVSELVNFAMTSEMRSCL
ncbi:D-alanine--D-alanine ligase [Pseudomonas guariconensis]|uniref:D-alanine--D-alanine ligase family protein n=1 Tax=Pseudomonas TaxID=286 RepID=UPI002098502E|nr:MULTISPECIES: D-alanine--D-alanine ligase family protein [Pseudomonas]MCO7643044.1 D-alanine--D-alanine ligase [Pseudomonas sp. S 311-6]MCO7516185.1 D-alanine--D-alanine ligase [Pseudomonas putida]MCO7567705.1 D-alanine--D-alanine ligase [Pseudomonas mosselii]MCO7597503.1 D-alanine--D-alanine ligase [Pseudomonas guariconensis]MCO7606021.1 D-alanine--D-alanine ligase [Pseudomonas guariconensis]